MASLTTPSHAAPSGRDVPIGTATAAGFGLGVALAAPPLVIGLANGDRGIPVGMGLAGVGLIAGSTLGVHLVAGGPVGYELGGAVGGGLLGTGVAVVGLGIGAAMLVPYMESDGGAPTSSRIVALTAVGVGGLIGATMPALGAAFGARMGSTPSVSLAPAVSGSRGPVPGLGVTIGLGGGRRAGAGGPGDR